VRIGEQPNLLLHGNGLLLLNEAIEELLNQLIIDRLFQRSKTNIRGVPLYAVLSLGFCGRKSTSGLLPAGALVRRPHHRIGDQGIEASMSAASRRIGMLVELLLRHFGMTSVRDATRLSIWKDGEQIHHDYGGDQLPDLRIATLHDLVRLSRKPVPIVFDIINIQHTRTSTLDPLKIELCDFGHYGAMPASNNPLMKFITRESELDANVLWPDHEGWVQPSMQDAVNFDHMGRRTLPDDLSDWSGIRAPFDFLLGPTIFGLGLARQIGQGKISRSDIAAGISRFVQDATRQPAGRMS
jgi:hypothetical protein